MSSGFDPYHKWLGIPAEEQPANYYRLLGLDLFETDRDAIECAADRLIQYVRHVATVEQRRQAREVLDGLAAAKNCLLITDQKQAYDAGLRAGRATTGDAKRPPPPPRIVTSAAVQIAAIDSKSPVTARNLSTASQPARRFIIIAAVIALIGASILGAILLRGDFAPKKQVAEIPAGSDTLTTSKQQEVIVIRPAGLEVATTDRDTGNDQRETIAPKAEPFAAKSALPAFKSQTPPLDPASDYEASTLAPLVGESPSVVASTGSTEPQAARPATSEHELPTGPDITGSEEPGELLREVWANVRGSKVEEFVQFVADHPEPNQTDTLDRFAAPEDFDDQYGQRLRGYLHPPASGSYKFSIRANAEGWLYVSTDALPENRQRVESGTQVEFEAGRAYYVEALHKESSGRDYLSIGWTLPDGTEEMPIPGERLSVHYRIAPRHEAEFVVLTPQSAKSSSGTTLEVSDDGVISTTDRATDAETYQLTFDSEMDTVTALRLEAIPDERLPASGPGRGIGGRFVLADLAVRVADRAAADATQALSFASAVDDAGRDVRRIVDGNKGTAWRVSGRGEQAAVTLIVHEPASFPAGARVNVELQQREALGRFRLLATSAPHPQSALRPAIDGDRALYSLLVNLGGDDFTTPDGVRWRASQRFEHETFGHEGGRGVSVDLIANKVQGSALRGIQAFRAVVPEGTYDVTLYFCEYWSTTPSSRRFAIAAEQRVVAANLDLFRAAGGFAKPLVYPIRNVTVNDGRLDIQFRATSNDSLTILNAIRIQQVR